MGTAERRLEMFKYLCEVRKTTMPELSKKFGVSVRTVQRDILEIEITFHAPLDIRGGRYGGVFVVGDYSFDRAYMCEEEIALLRKIESLVIDNIDESERKMLSKIIKKYSKNT